MWRIPIHILRSLNIEIPLEPAQNVPRAVLPWVPSQCCVVYGIESIVVGDHHVSVMVK